MQELMGKSQRAMLMCNGQMAISKINKQFAKCKEEMRQSKW